MVQEVVISATDASRGFSDLLHRVCYSGESFVIKKGHRMMAKITPVGEAEVIGAKKTRQISKKGQKTTPKLTKNTPEMTQNSPKSIPEGLTAADVDFYESLIAALPKAPA